MAKSLFEQPADPLSAAPAPGAADAAGVQHERDAMHSIGKRQGDNANATARAWHGTAFVLEVVVILLFVVISMAVLCSMFGKAYQIDQEADTLTRAITLATVGADNGAEAFEADPADTDCPAQTIYTYDGAVFARVGAYVPGTYVVRRTVEADETGGGTLYRATIDVSRYNETVYTLSVATYKSAGRSASGKAKGGDRR